MDILRTRGFRHAAPWAWLGLLVAVAYGGALGNDYVWDDVYFFGDYVWVYDLQTALSASLEPLFGQRSYFRPIPLLSLYAEALLSERNPAVSHATNLLLHWLCSGLVFLVARRAAIATYAEPASPRWILPLVLASIFAVHPALSETPIWISSRFDLMATFFVLLALWTSGLPLRDGPRAVALGLLFLVAALSKESAAVLPMLLGALAVLHGSAGRDGGRILIADAFKPRELKAYGALFIVGLLYLMMRHHAMSGTELLEVARPGQVEWVSRATTALAKYIQLTFLPFIGSSPHHTWTWPANGTLITFWQAHLAVVVLLVITFTLAARRRPSGWWLLAWLAAYLPVLHLVPLPIGQNVVHQRFMYLPTVALLALAPYALARVQASVLARRAAIAFSGLLILAAIPVDRSLVRVWENELTLWTWTTRAQPDSAEARENLVWAYLKYDMHEDAEREFVDIVKSGMHTGPTLAVNMGTSMYRQGNYEGALHYYRKAEPFLSVLTPTYRSRLFANMGITHALLGSVAVAQQYLLKSLEEDPRNHTAIGHLLGFCNGRPVDISLFHKEDLKRAQVVSDTTVGLLNQHQSSLHAERAFCPEVEH